MKKKSKNYTDEGSKGAIKRPVNPADSFKKSKKKKMTQAQDDAYDRTHGIKEGSKKDQMQDARNGIMDKKKKALKSQVIVHKKKAKNWIQGAIKHPGALHRELGVAEGKKIPQGKLSAAANRAGKLGQRARLAETLEGMHSKSKKSEYMKRVTKGTKYC